MDLTEATELAHRVRALYHRVEEHHEGGTWEIRDDMLGLVNDVGTLSRLVMATEGRWVPEGDVAAQLRGKLGECLWWVLVLADRLDVDVTEAYESKLGAVEAHLEAVIGAFSAE
jgi:NTP pyrophosphatase (non-canonical NTP hydrolase)